MENIFGKIPFLPDMNSKVHEIQQVAKQVINLTCHAESNTFPRRRKISLKLLLCNIFQMYIKLLFAAFCLLLRTDFSKRKSKKCRPVVGRSSPPLPFDSIHINLTFVIT